MSRLRVVQDWSQLGDCLGRWEHRADHGNLSNYTALEHDTLTLTLTQPYTMIDTTDTTETHRRPKAPLGQTQHSNGTSATLFSGGARSGPAAATPDDGENGTDSGSVGRCLRGVSAFTATHPAETAPNATASERGRSGAGRTPTALLVHRCQEGSEPSASRLSPEADCDPERDTPDRTAHPRSRRSSIHERKSHTVEHSVKPSLDGGIALQPVRGNDGQGSTDCQDPVARRPMRIRGGADPARDTHPGRNAGRNAKRDAVRVGTLNINGYGWTEPGHPDNKWGNIHRMMRAHNLAVLLVQEAHLTEERVQHIEKFTAKKLKIHFSPHPEQPTQRNGVAVVLNKRMLHAAGSHAETIVPGRAIQVSVPWQRNEELRLLCIYAPAANDAERKTFFDEVKEYYVAHPDLPRPHLMAGDFNNAEDVLDRIPAHENPEASVENLDALKSYLGLMLVNGWRATFPTTKTFTFQRVTALSRLDRIYLTEDLFRTARAWHTAEAEVRTDHSLVCVDLVQEKAPEMGRGRPVFPALIRNSRGR